MASEDIRIEVLLIEPDADSAAIIGKALANHFPEARWQLADNAAKALELLRQYSYDVVVCDAFIAGQDRIRFVETLCAATPDTPLLMITSDSDLSMDSFRDLPFLHAVLHKPISLKIFVEEVRRAIEEIKERRSVTS